MEGYWSKIFITELCYNFAIVWEQIEKLFIIRVSVSFSLHIRIKIKLNDIFVFHVLREQQTELLLVWFIECRINSDCIKSVQWTIYLNLN